MYDNVFEINYSIEANCDYDGRFPLYCATLLFDIIGISNDIIIKNRHAINSKKDELIQRICSSHKCQYYEHPYTPDSDYCVWIKETYKSNKVFIDLLDLQGLHLSYISVSDKFDFESIIDTWYSDDIDIVSTNVNAICGIIDSDRTLDLIFNMDIYSQEQINSYLTQWEYEIIKFGSLYKRVETKLRSKLGSKSYIRLLIS